MSTRVRGLRIPKLSVAAEMCSATDPVHHLMCCRRNGHGGRHKANGVEYVLLVWPNEPPAPSTPSADGAPAESHGHDSGPSASRGAAVGSAS